MTYFQAVTAYLLSHPAAPVFIAIVLLCTLVNVLRSVVTRKSVTEWIAANQGRPFVGAALRVCSGMGIDPAKIVVGALDMIGALINAVARSRGLPVPSDPPATASVTTTTTEKVEVILPKPPALPREEPEDRSGQRGVVTVRTLAILTGIACLVVLAFGLSSCKFFNPKTEADVANEARCILDHASLPPQQIALACGVEEVAIVNDILAANARATLRLMAVEAMPECRK